MRTHKSSMQPLHPVSGHVGANVTPQHLTSSGSSTPVNASMPDSVDQAEENPGMAPLSGDGMSPDLRAGAPWDGRKVRY